MRVAIIKYNAGNVFSVLCALNRIGVEAEITDDETSIRTADRVVFPGVGEASSAMAYLRQHGLDKIILSLKQPVLGICIGMQLLCRSSEEGNAECLGVFDVDVRRFNNALTPSLKIPHMGWNTLQIVGGDKRVIADDLNGKHVYFVHSYAAPVCQWTAAKCEYIIPFSAALQRENFYATQFHPEKSGSVGEQILRRFIEL